MSSMALNTWRTVRARRLARLRAAHAAFAGSGPGRRWRTEELNHALVLRLASEFQGFARDLHDEAVDALVQYLAPTSLLVQTALQAPYTANRRLDRGNADPGSLGADFGLLGMEFWNALNAHYPRRAPRWNERLATLTTARNGIAHDDPTKIVRVTTAGWPLTLRSIGRWHSALDGLARGMDRAVGDHLRLTFRVRPW